ncbi:MAG: class II glutamine amidotransferase, partial [Bdellovibrionaceae bacterium]|nr:class II glutamine amidotransferase [Pseudobdellovibrionaceae bacterium]
MKNNISDFLVVSFDCISSPNLKLNLKKDTPESSGWGIGWYPGDDYAASVVKDTGVKKIESMTGALSDWRRFRSTTFVCKVKGAAKRPSQQDTQPFQRSYWGRDWLFLHNGDLDKEKLKKLLGNTEGFLQPIGTTDSELAFCYLLQQFEKIKTKRIADLDPKECLVWFSQLDQLGVADMVLSDGQSLLSFHG